MTASKPDALERRYRRLLAWYPSAYRQENEDEMLGVLLAGAAGRRRPGLGESVDLVLGGLRIRARHAVRSFPDSSAVASLLAAVVLSLSLTSSPQNSLLVLEEVTPWVLLSLLGAVAAVASPGARHGLSRLGGARYATLVLAAVLVVVCQLLRYHWVMALWLLPVAVVLACRPTTRTGRRVLALLALPGTAYLVNLQDGRAGWATSYGLSAGVALALAGLLWTVEAQRHWRSSS